MPVYLKGHFYKYVTWKILKAKKIFTLVQTRNNGWSSFVKNCELF